MSLTYFHDTAERVFKRDNGMELGYWLDSCRKVHNFCNICFPGLQRSVRRKLIAVQHYVQEDFKIKCCAFKSNIMGQPRVFQRCMCLCLMVLSPCHFWKGSSLSGTLYQTTVNQQILFGAPGLNDGNRGSVYCHALRLCCKFKPLQFLSCARKRPITGHGDWKFYDYI